MASESVCVMFGCICISMYMCEEFPVEIQALVMLRLLHKLRIRLFLLIVRDGGCRRSQVKDDAEKDRKRLRIILRMWKKVKRKE